MNQPTPQPRRKWRWYKTADGKNLVEAELVSLPRDVQTAIVAAMKRKSADECFPNEDKDIRDYPIRELRISLDGNAYRVLYAPVAPHHEILLAVAVVPKKAQKLKKAVLKNASERLRDWESRGSEGVRRRSEGKLPSRRERARKKPRPEPT
jgi:phage-related protein